MSEERLTDIEVALAHDRHMIEELNEALVDANKEIARLTQRLATLERMVAGINDLVTGAPPNEKPPHY